jgi:LysM repeat protein
MRLTRLFTFITLIITLISGGIILPSNAQDDCGTTVTVQDGDTLAEIADQCATTVPALLATNPSITDPNLLRIGQVITLPTEANNVDPFVAISPQQGPPGTTVNIVANGLSIDDEVSIDMGPEDTAPILTQRAFTDEFGTIATTLTIPDGRAAANPRWLVTVTVLESGLNARSFPFFVTDAPPSSNLPLTEEPPLTPDVVLPPIEQTPQAPSPFTQTRVYLINMAAAPDDRICAEPVTGLEISIEPTVAPLTAAIESMLSTPDYNMEGVYNAFSLSNLTLEGIDINNGEAEIALSGELVTLGQCDSQWMPAQIRQTALQYDTINSVVITVNGEPLEDVIASRGI